MQSYVDVCTDFIMDNGFITHKRIYELTGTNCSYSVMRCLSKKMEFEVTRCKSSLGHSYNLYRFVKWRVDNPIT